mmetsp:Transcript_111270/g.314062  ORF Transcript_111270/g.314062 Transcript_111270/m.314062 type:complete len:559 (-) Transcript_111270:128-1804(-)
MQPTTGDASPGFFGGFLGRLAALVRCPSRNQTDAPQGKGGATGLRDRGLDSRFGGPGPSSPGGNTGSSPGFKTASGRQFGLTASNLAGLQGSFTAKDDSDDDGDGSMVTAVQPPSQPMQHLRVPAPRRSQIGDLGNQSQGPSKFVPAPSPPPQFATLTAEALAQQLEQKQGPMVKTFKKDDDTDSDVESGDSMVTALTFRFQPQHMPIMSTVPVSKEVTSTYGTPPFPALPTGQEAPQSPTSAAEGPAADLDAAPAAAPVDASGAPAAAPIPAQTTSERLDKRLNINKFASMPNATMVPLRRLGAAEGTKAEVDVNHMKQTIRDMKKETLPKANADKGGTGKEGELAVLRKDPVLSLASRLAPGARLNALKFVSEPTKVRPGLAKFAPKAAAPKASLVGGSTDVAAAVASALGGDSDSGEDGPAFGIKPKGGVPNFRPAAAAPKKAVAAAVAGALGGGSSSEDEGPKGVPKAAQSASGPGGVGANLAAPPAAASKASVAAAVAGALGGDSSSEDEGPRAAPTAAPAAAPKAAAASAAPASAPAGPSTRAMLGSLSDSD